MREAKVRGKRVFLRVDFNVPMNEGQIIDDNRIRAAVPTIKYLLEARAKIILGTHIGRPNGVDQRFSTIPVAKSLAKILNQRVVVTDLVIGPEVEKLAAEMSPGDILLLGNLRFDEREESNDDDFAALLARLADIYVNDAFAVCHRLAASTVAIASKLPAYVGLLLESEITTLNLLLSKPEQPFILVIGGAKIKDKAGVISRLASKVDKILVGGAVANTFLVARGEYISSSFYDQERVFDCKALLIKYGDKIILPLDASKVNLGHDNFQIVDIGPRTIANFSRELARAKSVFWNGNMGHSEDERFTAGTRAIAEALRENRLTSVVAGGDTVGFLNSHNLAKGISFISTGGGAALKFLAGERLPGIEVLK